MHAARLAQINQDPTNFLHLAIGKIILLHCLHGQPHHWPHSDPQYDLRLYHCPKMVAAAASSQTGR